MIFSEFEKALEEFKEKDLSDFMVKMPQPKNEKKNWWMKYLNDESV